MNTTRRAFFSVALAAAAVLASAATGSHALAAAPTGIVVTFTSGTGDASGRITITNASNGSTASVGLIPKLTAAECAAMLSATAPKVGFKAEVNGATVTITGKGAVVKVEGASITKSDLASAPPSRGT
jgi:hypothetical protein